MVARGGARVRVYTDTSVANEALLAPERAAREAGRGLWGKAAYRIPQASRLPETFARFQLVEGIVEERLRTEEQGASCELGLTGSALTLEIKRSAAALCQVAAGAHVRARGYVHAGKLEIGHTLNLEALAEDQAAGIHKRVRLPDTGRGRMQQGDTRMMGTSILIGLAILVFVAVVVIYNGLVNKNQMVKNGWADIDVQLKRRADLIPQLVTTVKGFAAHENSLFEDVVAKRGAALAAGDDPQARGAAESALSQPVARLVAVAEAYPELKSDQNFLDLQNELSDTENKIEMARRFFNGAVREMNTRVQSFPTNLVAAMFGFREKAFFEIQTADRALPSVDFKGE